MPQEQLKRALDLIATLPSTPELRREEIKLQVELITPLLHVRDYAAPETRAAVERAHLLIEQSDALGEPPDDPLLLFSVLYGFWVANLVAFNGDVLLELRLMGLSLLHAGKIEEGRTHFDRAVELYDPAEHGRLAILFGQDIGAASLSWRAIAWWLLGYPENALADARRALELTRDARHAPTLIYVLNFSFWTHIRCGAYTAAAALVDEYVPLQSQMSSTFWGAWGLMQRGCLAELAGQSADAARLITSGVEAMRSTGSTMWTPLFLSYLARANAHTGRLSEAWTNIDEAAKAIEMTKEDWHDAELNRVAGEIALMSPEPDAAKAEAYFARALVVARRQLARSWELRAATSMARLFIAQGRRRPAREIRAPVWFTQGFDTLDLRQAKSLLDELAP